MLAAELPSDLAASHDLLHALLEVSLPGIILFRPVYATEDAAILLDLAYVYLNPAAQQMLHLPARPAETFRTLYPNALATGIFAFYRDTFLSGQPGDYAVNYPYDGLDNFFLLKARRCGELLVVGFTDTAVQERSQVEQALRESQAFEQAAHAAAEQQRQRFREVLTQMPAYIAVYQGPDHIYQFVNPAYQSLFPHRSFLGRPFREGTPEAVELGVVALFDQVYQTGEPIYLREMEGWFDFHGNGQPVQVFLNISLHPLRNVQGEIDGVLDFTYDVSEQVRSRRQVEELNQELEARVQQRTQELATSNAELQASNHQLTRTNVDLDTFVYTASHDLKAPITNIEGLLHALRDTLPGAVQQDDNVGYLLHLLEQTVARFQLTLTQLTDVSRLQRAPVEPAELVELAPVVEAVRLDLLPAIAAAATRLTVEVVLSLRVPFSPANLRSIVYNLLSNAIKYCSPERPSQVWVRAEQTPQALVLTVQDNGLGLSERQQRQLFGLFQRLHTHVEGTGIGLYITKHLIENAGGTITVQSQLNEGTTFTVTFPTYPLLLPS